VLINEGHFSTKTPFFSLSQGDLPVQSEPSACDDVWSDRKIMSV